ncbi:hypothetical protein BDR03DRAFT_741236 [Suillus americanus]|nr:hypothetical protein BDR03DRAFT_741236 [Suillus americanus]
MREIGYPDWMFVISARLFFMDIPPEWFNHDAAPEVCGLVVPWVSWGPPNSRCFRIPNTEVFEVGGSRVISVVQRNHESEVHMVDFNPFAVARGIGKVVREHSFSKLRDRLGEYPVTTYLPYVEVVSDRAVEPYDVVLDEEMVVMFLHVSVFLPVKPVNITISVPLDRMRWWRSPYSLYLTKVVNGELTWSYTPISGTLIYYKL